MNNKTLFFPYTSKSYPLIHNLLERKKEFEVASYKGSGLVGKDIAVAINSHEEGLIVKNIFEINLHSFNHLVILDSDFEKINFTDIMKIVDDFNKQGGKVTILSRFIKNKISQIKHNGIKEFIYEIKKPIIYVTGIYDTVFNSLTSVGIQRALEKKGIHTNILTFDSNLAYLNYHVVDYSEHSFDNLAYYIYYLRRDIQRILSNETLDALIIQVPGGLVQSNERHFNDFGIYYTVFNDIAEPDYIICNFPYYFKENGTLNQVDEIIQYKSHKKIDSILFNNYYMKTNEPISLSANKDIVFVPENIKERNHEQLDIELSNKIKKSYSEIALDIINKLGGD